MCLIKRYPYLSSEYFPLFFFSLRSIIHEHRDKREAIQRGVLYSQSLAFQLVISTVLRSCYQISHGIASGRKHLTGGWRCVWDSGEVGDIWLIFAPYLWRVWGVSLPSFPVVSFPFKRIKEPRPESNAVCKREHWPTLRKKAKGCWYIHLVRPDTRPELGSEALKLNFSTKVTTDSFRLFFFIL